MKKRISLLLWVFKEQLKVSRVLFAWKFAYALFDGVSSIVFVYVSAQLLNSVTKVALTDGKASEVYKWIILLFFTDVVVKVVSRVNFLADKKISDKIEMSFNEKLMVKMYELSQSQFESETLNTAIDRAYDGINSAQRTLTEISWLVSSFVRFFGSFFTIAAVSPFVGVLVVMLSIPGVILSLKQNRYSEKVYRDIEPTERIAYRTRWLLIDPHSMPEIRLVNGFKKLLKEWKKYMTKTDDAYYMLTRRNNLQSLFADITEPLTESIANFLYFRSLLSGAIELDRFIFLRSLTEQFINSVGSIASSMHSMDQRFIELDNFRSILDQTTDLPNGTISVKKSLTIEFKNVWFRYPTSESFTLEDVSFLIVPGSKIALVGENGAGKTTLLKLLLRQYLPTKGEILVNGVNIKDIEQESYYAQISNLSQDFITVTHLTIKDNLTLGIQKEDEKKIDNVMSLVDAKDFVYKLKYKLETRLDTSFKDGTDLSGGQLQRLGVARALLREGDVMILDEPTSAIDAKAEFSIFNNIYKAHAGKTTIIVSHRFSTVRKADAILVMQKGKIIEYGSHEELLKYGGLYKEMFDLQAEGYK